MTDFDNKTQDRPETRTSQSAEDAEAGEKWSTRAAYISVAMAVVALVASAWPIVKEMAH